MKEVVRRSSGEEAKKLRAMGLFEQQVCDVLSSGCYFGQCAVPEMKKSTEQEKCGENDFEVRTVSEMSFSSIKSAKNVPSLLSTPHAGALGMLDTLDALMEGPPLESFSADEDFHLGEQPIRRKHSDELSDFSVITPREASVPAEPNVLTPVEHSGSRKRPMMCKVPAPKQLKSWKNATPSRYCHCCGGVARGEKLVCSNLAVGTCRKVFCKSCLEKIYGKDWKQEVEEDWECTHCNGACPEKASCHYYTRTNSMRPNRSQR